MTSQIEFMQSLAEFSELDFQDDLPQTRSPIYLLGRSYSALYGKSYCFSQSIII